VLFDGGNDTPLLLDELELDELLELLLLEEDDDEDELVVEPDDELSEEAQVSQDPASHASELESDSEAGEATESGDESREDELVVGEPGSDADTGSSDEDGQRSDADSDEASPETSINAYELIGSTEDQATEAETDAATLKAVLEAIGDQLIGQQPEGDGHVQREWNLLGV